MNTSSIPPERFRTIEPERTCSYLDDEVAALEYRVYATLTPAELEELLSRGWRRFGTYVFRPACQACEKCIPLRIDVENFHPSKSQRKARNRNQHIQVTLHQPQVTRQHIDLYNAWHKDMTERRDWRPQQTNVYDYVEGFLSGEFSSIHEIRYWDDNVLVGVGLVDILPNSISSAYFYHAPAWRSLSPGTFSMLCEIQLAQQMGLRWVYLGYWIEKCQSMAYKNRFYPHQVLLERPDDDQEPGWETVTKE